MTSFNVKDSDAKTVLETKRGDMENIGALENDGEATQIELIRVVHGRAETN
jgi:hypothetical protein